MHAVNQRRANSGRSGPSSGDVPATPFPSSYDREYLISVAIGTPPQLLPLNLDTGSSDLYVPLPLHKPQSQLISPSWVFSSNTPRSEVAGQKLYNISASKTSRLLIGQTWAITYGDGSTSSGTVYSDNVTLGGVTVSSQAVESAQTVSPTFTGVSASSGLFGLGMTVLNTVRPTKQATWFDNIKASLALPLFTANLKRGAVGSYDFGFINPSLYTGIITYAPLITSRGFWEFSGTGYQIGSSGTFNYSPLDIIADSGTSLLLLPQAVVTKYYANVTGSTYDTGMQAYIFPCASVLPAFIFGLDGSGNGSGVAYRGIIPGNYMNYGQTSATMCYGGIQSQGGLAFSVFGDIALKAQFVVFDAGNSRIGFANKKT
ncbi:hypothetical protein B7494_g1333 [Chlorociboria aeruginascens]|nr:hypothetical protein B7494_g1333 [Chlorociboria aeruginascens]